MAHAGATCLPRSRSYNKSGAGYGIKLAAADRDVHFKKSWTTATLLLDGERAAVNLDKPSFWGPTCRELISQDIGRRLFAKKAAPWPAGKPPRVKLEPQGAAVFAVT